MASSAGSSSVHSFSGTLLDGRPLELATLAGRPALIVNVASEWGDTDAVYSQLAEWHRRYGTRLTILLYPSDEFRAMCTTKACMAGQCRPGGLVC